MLAMSARFVRTGDRRGPLKVHRDGRPIDWSAFDTGPLDESARAHAGASWRARMGQEYLAVGAFATLVHEVAAEGCEPVILKILTGSRSSQGVH